MDTRNLALQDPSSYVVFWGLTQERQGLATFREGLEVVEVGSLDVQEAFAGQSTSQNKSAEKAARATRVASCRSHRKNAAQTFSPSWSKGLNALLKTEVSKLEPYVCNTLYHVNKVLSSILYYSILYHNIPDFSGSFQTPGS